MRIVPERRSGTRTVLGAGLTAGALDITAACGFYALRGVSPVRIFQSVASGLLGSAAFTGGAPTAVLGGVLHFTIALVAAAVFYLASRHIVCVGLPIALIVRRYSRQPDAGEGEAL